MANGSVSLDTNPYYLTDETDLFDYSWKYSDDRNKIRVISKSYGERKLPILIKARTKQECENARNELCSIFENDVINNKRGRLYVGDYYIECFVISSKKDMHTIRNNHALIEYTIATKGDWTREQTIDFLQESHSTGGFDYEYDYEYDFGLENAGESTLTNEHYYDVNFIITVSGQCTNPSITIGDNTYTVNVELNVGDNLFINSKEKTIYVIRANGYYENRFASRDRSNYIFEPIKSGYQKVSWNGEYRWQITLIEERSEPKWT